MLKLHVIQAEYGDCLLLEFGTLPSPRYILVDGGPVETYPRHLKGELQKIRDRGGKLDVVIASHVDNDHVIGLLDLTAELREQQASGEAETIAIDALWHNAFRQTVGSGNNIEARLRALLAAAGSAAGAMTLTSMAVQGFDEGNQLRLAATLLDIPINSRFAQKLVLVDNAPPQIDVDGLSLRVVGPTKQNLEGLKQEWLAWLDEYEDSVASGDPFLAANADRSVPNLSSIMVFAEAEGKKVLFTGDGRSDHLLQGLKQAGLLDAQGRLHVDVLKLPHHGSDRNVTKTFFKKVTADKYVVSANGTDDNPDLATLIWVVEAAKRQKRSIEIVATNRTPSLQQLLQEYRPDKYGYQLTVMAEGSHAVTLELAS